MKRRAEVPNTKLPTTSYYLFHLPLLLFLEVMAILKTLKLTDVPCLVFSRFVTRHRDCGADLAG